MPQSLSKVLVHIIFSTKNRAPIIAKEIQPELYSYLAKVFKECDSPAIKIGGVDDHVHILCVLSRKLPLTEVMERIKKRSSKWIKTKGDEFAQFYWQAGYGGFSVSQTEVEAVVHYIESQEEHHRRISFQEEYREFLKRYEVDYDERYVWD